MMAGVLCGTFAGAHLVTTHSANHVVDGASWLAYQTPRRVHQQRKYVNAYHHIPLYRMSSVCLCSQGGVSVYTS